MRNAFLSALPVIAGAIGDSLGVQVVMNAGNPRTDGKVIYLPSLDGDCPESRKLGIGYIVHEASHLRFTDFEQRGETPFLQHINNLLEDIRIEQNIAQVLPGCRSYLADMIEGLVKTDSLIKLEADDSPSKVMESYMSYQLRLNLLGQEGIKSYAEQAEEQLLVKVPAGMRVRLEALMYQVRDCESTKEVLDLARAIIRMMEEEAKKEEDKENQPKQQQAGSDPNQQSQDQGQGPAARQPDDQHQGDAPTHQQGAGDGPDNGLKASEVIRQMLASGAEDGMKDIGSILEEALGQAEAHCASSALPFTNIPFDQSALANVVDIETERNRVYAASNALKSRSQALLQAKTLSSSRNVMEGVKLNVRNLHQARCAGPVFLKENPGIAVDTAIAILVDRSTSMSKRIGLAMDAALATTMAFQRPDVKTAVFAFPYTNGKEGNAVLKTWDSQPAASIPAYRLIGVEGCTPMAEAMMGVCTDLVYRKQKRKILLVVTDGQPDDAGKAQWVIDLARKSGVEVLGLGICHDTSTVFGPQWSGHIDDIGTLPAVMIGMLSNVILKKAA